jgi:hypothetical protein
VTSKLEAMRIVTRCTSREQFVTTFRRFCDPKTCFVPSSDTRPVGSAMAFSIRLADGTPVLRGDGIVLHAWPTGDNPFKRPGVQLGIARVSDDSAALFEELLTPGSVVTPLPPADQLRMLREPATAAASLETPTLEMPVVQLRPMAAEARGSGALAILPANPLSEMTDDLLDAFVECTLSEEIDTAPVIRIPIPREDTLPGVMPIVSQVYAAPALIPTELVDRVRSVETPALRRRVWFRIRRWYAAVRYRLWGRRQLAAGLPSGSGAGSRARSPTRPPPARPG